MHCTIFLYIHVRDFQINFKILWMKNIYKMNFIIHSIFIKKKNIPKMDITIKSVLNEK